MAIETQGLALEDTKLVASMAKGNPMLRELKARMGNPVEDTMFLTALGAMMETRIELETKRERMFEQTAEWADEEINGYDEVIIGGGPTAAAYAAVRTRIGRPRPLVITDTLGGKSFPMVPWFRLNSTNRPGELGLSSEEAALNVIPGSPVQPSMLNMDKYQDNSVPAFVTRTSLMRNADLRKGTVDVVQVADRGKRRFIVGLVGGGVVYADRVLDARGLGEPVKLTADGSYGDSPLVEWSERILSVYGFAKRFVGPFPFRDYSRVAVIGSGDSGKVVVEALLGTGPNRHMSVPMLDWVEQIDWYGNSLPVDCTSWRDSERGRYQDIGAFLNRPDEGRARLRVFQSNAVSADEGLDKVYVSGRPYDAVIVAIGFRSSNITGAYDRDSGFFYANDGRTALGRKVQNRELYQIGVTAALPFDISDPDSTKRLANNKVALFRNLPRVVQLAMKLPAIQPGLEVTSAKVLRTTRKLLGKGLKGVKIRLGDEVRLLDQFGGEFARGKAVKFTGKPDVVFAIKPERYNFTGEDLIPITTEQLESITVIVGDLPRPKKETESRRDLGYDASGNPLREGDRVSFTDYNGDRYEATVRDGEFQFLLVQRDGYSSDDRFELDEDEYNSVEKED